MVKVVFSNKKPYFNWKSSTKPRKKFVTHQIKTNFLSITLKLEILKGLRNLSALLKHA